jgi:hypothetical protein
LFGITSLPTLLALIAETYSECCSCRHCYFMNRSSVCYDLFFVYYTPQTNFSNICYQWLDCAHILLS